LWATAYTPVFAQSPLPAATVAEASALERSQRQSDNVYRWIKLHAEPQRKAEPARVRPKPESTGAVARKPDTSQTEAAVPQDPPETLAGVDKPVTSAQAEALLEAAPTGAGVATSATAAAQLTPAAPVPEVEVALRAIAQPQPEFPRELRSTVTQGKVVMAFTVQPDGSVSEPTVLNTTNRKLSKPALEAVAKWRFEPIRIARVAQVEIAFDLQ
jgi:protein TonB